MPRAQTLRLNAPDILILGAIHRCEVERHNDLDMHYYKKQGRTEVVDITTIQCLVGRIKDRGWWTIIDRSGKLARAIFDLE